MRFQDKGMRVRGGSNKYNGLLKGWNNEGRVELLRRHVAEDRVPVISEVFRAYQPNLLHVVQIGHTAMFFNIPSFYEEMSK